MSEDQSAEEAQQAAAKIQAGFRGYRVRKRLQEEKQAAANANANQLPGENSSSPAHEDDNGSCSCEDEQPDMEGGLEEPGSAALEEKSATKIQAGVRGFLVRKRQQAEQAAATRIQAGFRGFRTRKLLKQSGQ